MHKAQTLQVLIQIASNQYQSNEVYKRIQPQFLKTLSSYSHHSCYMFQNVFLLLIREKHRSSHYNLLISLIVQLTFSHRCNKFECFLITGNQIQKFKFLFKICTSTIFLLLKCISNNL